MKKAVFVSFYDMICYGLRTLSSVAKQIGIESHLFLLKRETGYVPIFWKKSRGIGYQFFYNGLLRNGEYDVNKITNKEIEIFIDKLKEISPDLICFSSMSLGYELCKDIFLKVKKKLPNTPILSGGWGPTLKPEKFLEFSDYVVVLEGEKTIQYICKAIKEEMEFSKAPNLIYYKNGKLIRNPVAPALSEQELDSLPFADFFIENKYFIKDNSLLIGKDFYNEKVYDCIASRGCPLNCSYCMASKYGNLYKSYSGQFCSKFRLRSLNVVFDEIRRAKERGAKFIRFKDDVFPFYQKWIDEFIEKYPKEIGLPFFCYLHPKLHKSELIKKLKDVGLLASMNGIQSGSSEIRNKIYNRVESKEEIIEFTHLLEELNIQFAYHFIYMNPLEKEHHLKESLEFTFQLPYQLTFVFRLVLFPDLPLNTIVPENSQLPANVHDWYAILHSMSLRDSIFRRIAKFIYKFNLMKKYPHTLSYVFIIPLLEELYTRFKNKHLLNAGSCYKYNQK